MSWLKNLILAQGKLIIENKRQAMLHVVIFSLLPFTTWIAVSIIALVTLRRGWRNGGWLLSFGMLFNFSLSLTSLPMQVAIFNTVLIYAPCYFAALILRTSKNWQAVIGLFSVQVLVAMVMIQMFIPHFIVAQFLYFQNLLKEVQVNSPLLSLINNHENLNSMILGSYLLGIQAVGIVLSACISLMCARSIQSQLYYPGGFKQEMLTFRGNKLGLLILILIFIAARHENVLAMCLLPMFVFYFLLAGLSLSINLLTNQRIFSAIFLLITPLVLLPFIMLPVYVVFGSIDTLFNLRLYLRGGAGKAI